jgi:hypothetical protein
MSILVSAKRDLSNRAPAGMQLLVTISAQGNTFIALTETRPENYCLWAYILLEDGIYINVLVVTSFQEA